MQPLAGRRAAVLTLSETVARGAGRDESGDAAVETITSLGAEVVVRDALPDDQRRITERLRAYADDVHVDLVLTTGGSGLAVGDVTPEATLAVVERLVPGLPEVARMRTLEKTPLAVLSRGVAGIRGRTLIINLPGSPKAVREWLEVMAPVLPHAIALLHGDSPPWGTPHRT
jgi:molybdopterin adenylyltransferase